MVAWDGCVYPYAFSIRDFEPIVGRVHQPPPVHQTFAGPGFVVCSFVPRPLDFGDNAVRIPYHHANTDSDEVLFYVDGDFTSRQGAGIGRKSITLHPAGFVHGPQPGATRLRCRRDRPTRRQSCWTPSARWRVQAARDIADGSYVTSWLGIP